MSWQGKIGRFIKKDDKRVAFFIHLRDKQEKVNDFLRELLQSSPTLHLAVFFNMKVPTKIAQANLNTKTSEDYLSADDCEAIDIYIFNNLSRAWYIYKNVTEYRGIHLGQIFEYEFQKYLTPLIKNLKAVREIVVRENIQKVITIEDTGELNRAVRIVADTCKISTLEISFTQSKGLFFQLYPKIKSILSDFLSEALDDLTFSRILKDKDEQKMVLIDSRLGKYFERQNRKIRCLLSPLEKGTNLRINLVRRGLVYFALCLKEKDSCRRSWGEYRRKWLALSKEEDFKKIFTYQNISIWKLVNQRLSTFFSESLPRIITNIDRLETLLKARKIRLAVLRNDVRELEKTIILTLRLAKIPSLVIQHGILAECNGHNILLADKFAAWGNASVDWYVKFNNPRERFIITGNPRFDILTDWRPKFSKKQLCQRLNLDEDKGIILLVPQQINKFSSFWTDDLFLTMTDKILSAMEQFPDKQLIIKVDPYEELAGYKQRLAKNSHKNCAVVKDIDIYTLIFLSELIVTMDSTVGLEAMVFDKPLIVVNLTKRKDRVPYAEKEAAVGIYQDANLASAIKKALTDEKTILQLNNGRKRFIKEYAYVVDGKAGERIAQLIQDYLNN